MNLEHRTAVEALRAGVPNRAAVRLMGTAESGIENANGVRRRGDHIFWVAHGRAPSTTTVSPVR